MSLEIISKLQIDPYINFVLIGSQFRDQVINLWKHREQKFTHTPKYIVTTTQHKIKNTQMICNMWSVSNNCCSTERYFLTNHVDCCYIICNLRAEGQKNLYEYATLCQSLCPQAEINVIGLMQSDTDDDDHKMVIQNIVTIKNYCQKLGASFHKVSATNWVIVKGIFDNKIKHIYQSRNKQVNDKFRQLINS